MYLLAPFGKDYLSLTSCKYKKAYESMKACPLEFQRPSQAQQLNGLGSKLCDRLTDKSKAHCQENGLPMPQPPEKGLGIDCTLAPGNGRSTRSNRRKENIRRRRRSTGEESSETQAVCTNITIWSICTGVGLGNPR